MRFGRLGDLLHGYNAMTTRESAMLMDIGYQLFDENEVVEFADPLQETAFVILTGKVEIAWDGKKEIMERHSLFEENPYCLLVPKNTTVTIKSLQQNTEVLVQKTINEKSFQPDDFRLRKCTLLQYGKWGGHQ